MRAVVQRVSRASVTVDGIEVGRIERGILVYLGVAKGDSDADVEYLAGKLTGLRVFPDAEGKMSLAPGEVGASALVISQFTLLGDLRKGRRPSFDSAAAPEDAEALYEAVISRLRELGLPTASGRFRAHMVVSADVDGPVTLLLDSSRSF